MSEIKTINEIKAVEDIPVVIADENGKVIYINKQFTSDYGWSADEIMGKEITIMIPPDQKKAHEYGFSRFLITEQSKMLGTTIDLQIMDKDRDVYNAQHYIVAEKIDGKWEFGATIKKLEQKAIIY